MGSLACSFFSAIVHLLFHLLWGTSEIWHFAAGKGWGWGEDENGKEIHEKSHLVLIPTSTWEYKYTVHLQYNTLHTCMYESTYLKRIRFSWMTCKIEIKENWGGRLFGFAPRSCWQYHERRSSQWRIPNEELFALHYALSLPWLFIGLKTWHFQLALLTHFYWVCLIFLFLIVIFFSLLASSYFCIPSVCNRPVLSQSSRGLLCTTQEMAVTTIRHTAATRRRAMPVGRKCWAIALVGAAVVSSPPSGRDAFRVGGRRGEGEGEANKQGEGRQGGWFKPGKRAGVAAKAAARSYSISPFQCLNTLHESTWFCASNWAGTNLSRPIGAPGAWHGVKELLFPYPEHISGCLPGPMRYSSSHFCATVLWDGQPC